MSNAERQKRYRDRKRNAEQAKGATPVTSKADMIVTDMALQNVKLNPLCTPADADCCKLVDGGSNEQQLQAAQEAGGAW